LPRGKATPRHWLWSGRRASNRFVEMDKQEEEQVEVVVVVVVEEEEKAVLQQGAWEEARQ